MEKQYSVACLIAGILSCVLCCMCLGFPLGIAGVVLFILSTRNGNGTETKAAVGLALSIVGFILSIITAIYLVAYIMDSYYSDYRYYDNDSIFDDFDYDNDSLDYYNDYYSLPYKYDEGVFDYDGSNGINEF